MPKVPGSQRYIILSGPPGAGKTTIGRQIQLLSGFPHLSIGEELRAVNLAERFGNQCDKIAKRGDMLPDDIVYQVLCSSVERKMRAFGKTPVVILDGFPKTIGQVGLLTRYFTATAHVEIVAPREILIERCLTRFGQERRNHDSSRSMIKRRINYYYSNTKLILDSTLRLPKCHIDSASPSSDATAHIIKFIMAQLN